MRTGESYKLKVETIGIVLDGNSRTTIMIPKGSIVKVGAPGVPPISRAVLVEVEWNERAVLMFVTDLQQHGEIVSGIGSSPATP